MALTPLRFTPLRAGGGQVQRPAPARVSEEAAAGGGDLAVVEFVHIETPDPLLIISPSEKPLNLVLRSSKEDGELIGGYSLFIKPGTTFRLNLSTTVDYRTIFNVLLSVVDDSVDVVREKRIRLITPRTETTPLSVKLLVDPLFSDPKEEEVFFLEEELRRLG